MQGKLGQKKRVCGFSVGRGGALEENEALEKRGFFLFFFLRGRLQYRRVANS